SIIGVKSSLCQPEIIVRILGFGGGGAYGFIYEICIMLVFHWRKRKGHEEKGDIPAMQGLFRVYLVILPIPRKRKQ
ncbi:hypothetical protein XELAEV_18014354mg, partial [Xenopus laevis]